MKSFALVAFFLLAGTCAAQETFTAVLTSAKVIRGGESSSTDASIATADFTLEFDASDPASTRLNYSLTAPDFDFTGARTPELSDDVTAVHLHTLLECASPTCVAGDTAGTRHVLNIFGAPREDDADLFVDGEASTIRGTWDPSDANTLTPAPSADPNDFLTELASDQLFIMIHTRAFPAGAVGGVLVPEPASGFSAILAGLVVVHIVRRRSSNGA